MKQTKARDIMVQNVVSVRPTDVLTDAIRLLLSHRISGLPVVDDNNNVLGCVTEHDIMNFAFSGEADVTQVNQAMTQPAFTFSPDTNIENIINSFAKHRIRRVIITEGDQLAGIVSRRDVLREMLALYTG